jgi:tetratricopeptide (TPR) repeat protein
MANEAFQRGCSLFVDEDFEEALVAFSQAIDLAGPAAANKETAEYYVKRSACHAKLQHHTDAVADANAALVIDPHNPRALLRKGYAEATPPPQLCV